MRKIDIALLIIVILTLLGYSVSIGGKDHVKSDAYYDTETYCVAQIAQCTANTNLLQSFENYSGFDRNINYLEEMIMCCINGDTEKGYELEAERALKIETMDIVVSGISYDDLFLLSKIIEDEAGSSWLSDEWRMMVGEVLLNRVASFEFPNSIKECFYQRGQYAAATRSYFATLLPGETSVRVAARLLSGERVINDSSVVFQSNSPQGGGVYAKLHDSILGTTYFCYSSRPELYGSEVDGK